MSDPVICEVAIGAPVDAAWRALREPSGSLVIRTPSRVILSRYD